MFFGYLENPKFLGTSLRIKNWPRSLRKCTICIEKTHYLCSTTIPDLVYTTLPVIYGPDISNVFSLRFCLISLPYV